MKKTLLVLFLLGLFLSACGESPTPTLPPTDWPLPIAPPPVIQDNPCTEISIPTPSQSSLFPAVTSQDHTRGAADPAVTVLMYGDFTCADCARMDAVLEALLQKYPDIRLVYRSLPQPKIQEKSLLSLQAAEAAEAQGKYWQMYDLLFAKQANWMALTPQQLPAWLTAQAASLGMDTAQFQQDLEGRQAQRAAQTALQNSQRYGQVPLPLLLINGEVIKNAYILASLENLVRLYALPARQFHTCPPILIDSQKNYTATLKTSKGEITLNLFANKAPNTVNNFVFLAKNGWYDNVPFHRVIPNFMAQTGDPSGTGMGNPGYFIPDEISASLQYDRAGMVGMANSGQDTNGSQFFITYGPAPQLNGIYTLFGEVTNGMDVLTHLTPRDPTAAGALPAPDMLLGVTIEEK